MYQIKQRASLQKTEEIEDDLEEYKEDKEAKDRYEKLKAFGTYLSDEFYTYIANNGRFIVNYNDHLKWSIKGYFISIFT